ncbi:AMP-binding protein [Paraburkholderia rhynchosiae]|nr:AMP-binding protein [Paraburkholderia rhynchosiae]CAB3735721.1 3-[(3aS,4S,7aS)-7a-methyl-1, 5-dioxo-octahydro-1H-inden-4-yl]propanoyl:CoA ligase [Paraburkholderia rhynchosiae]
MTDHLLTDSYVAASNELPVIHKTVGDFFRDAASTVPDRLALVEIPSGSHPKGRTWTYQQLLVESERVAAGLLRRFAPGERLAVWASNRAEYVSLQLGAALAGVVLVTLNPACRTEEMRYFLHQSEAAGLVMSQTFRGLDNAAVIDCLRAELGHLRTIAYFDDWEEFLGEAHSPRPLPQVDIDDPVLILYTSGTTGKPKGVVHRHQSLVNNARASTARYGLDTGAVWLATLPMFHVGGSVTATLGCIANLGTQVMMPEFKPDLMMRLIEEYRATITTVVPTMVLDMLEHETFGQFDLSSLELMLTGGTIVTPEIVRSIREEFNVDVGVIFGQTEAGGVMAQTCRGEPEERLCNSVGRAISNCEMKIAHAESGEPLPIGEIGEICVRSPFLMKGYLRMPEATAATIDGNGWLHTGDLGVMRPDGYIRVTGRLKDMIIRGGENIYPREIEDLLSGHPELADVAVFGIPDERWGEQVAAAIRVKPGATASSESLEAFLDGKIARHKIPRHWMRVDAFPTNASGKVQKFLLRDLWLEHVKDRSL